MNKEVLQKDIIVAYLDPKNGWLYGAVQHGHYGCTRSTTKLKGYIWKTFPREYFTSECSSGECCTPLFDFSQEEPTRLAVFYIVKLQKESLQLLGHNDVKSEELENEAERLLRHLLQQNVSFSSDRDNILVFYQGIPWMYYTFAIESWKTIKVVESR